MTTARRILLEKADDFERLAKGLLEYETLTGDEIRKVIAGEPLTGGDDADKPTSGRRRRLRSRRSRRRGAARPRPIPNRHRFDPD